MLINTCAKQIYSLLPVSTVVFVSDRLQIRLQMEQQPTVYILANKPWGTLYTGVTSHLPSRVYQHKKKLGGGFTAKYNVDRLVYYESFGDMYYAITREKQIKGGSRSKKLQLIVGMNPDWRDLYEDILG